MKINVAVLQFSCGENTSDNLAQACTQIATAAQSGAQLIVLPELHNSRYFCQQETTDNFDLAESIPGPTTEQLAMLAKQHNAVIVSSLFEKRSTGIFHNTAVVFDSDGSIAGKYRKMHIPDDPGYSEKFYFTPGDLGFTPIQTHIGKLGILVCWDQWFPEAARLMSLAGAELLIYPTAIGWDTRDDAAEKQRQLDAWQTVQRGHAIANGLPLIACNRVGLEPDPSEQTPGIDFWGHSFIAGPQGEWLAQADTTAQILTATIDTKRSETVRRIWPFLRDRRIDAYSDLLARYID